MRKLILLLTMCFMLITVSACFDNGHSHDDGSHSHAAPEHHDSIN